MHSMDASKLYSKKDRWELHKNVVHCLEQSLEATLHKTVAV